MPEVSGFNAYKSGADFTLDGGAKKRATKKTPAKKATVAVKSTPKPKTEKKVATKKTNVKKGGDLMQNMAGLAVPFAFLLAKQGLEALKDSKSTKAPKEPKREMVKPYPKYHQRSKKASLSGGGCSSCVSTTLAGGNQVSANMLRLRKEIDNFLAKY